MSKRFFWDVHTSYSWAMLANSAFFSVYKNNHSYKEEPLPPHMLKFLSPEAISCLSIFFHFYMESDFLKTKLANSTFSDDKLVQKQYLRFPLFHLRVPHLEWGGFNSEKDLLGTTNHTYP